MRGQIPSEVSVVGPSALLTVSGYNACKHSRQCVYRQLSRFATGTAMPAAEANIGSSSQEGAQLENVMLAKSCDCCAVVGQVCWFCLKSEPHLSRSLLEAYG